VDLAISSCTISGTGYDGEYSTLVDFNSFMAFAAHIPKEDMTSCSTQGGDSAWRKLWNSTLFPGGAFLETCFAGNLPVFLNLTVVEPPYQAAIFYSDWKVGPSDPKEFAVPSYCKCGDNPEEKKKWKVRNSKSKKLFGFSFE